jgi:hypothetical protein
MFESFALEETCDICSKDVMFTLSVALAVHEVSMDDFSKLFSLFRFCFHPLALRSRVLALVMTVKEDTFDFLSSVFEHVFQRSQM